jgi:nucleoside-diphosphate-sugar epimerase
VSQALPRALITGATGFVGSHLTRHLLARGFEVHALCRRCSSFERLEDVRHRLHVHTASLTDRHGLRRVVGAIMPQYIAHLAAATMHAGTSATAAAIVRTNLLGTVNLIDACDGIDYAGFVNAGDAFEYGPKRRPAKESDRCRPTTLDGRAKEIATLYARYAGLARGRPIVTLRLFSVFGPGDHPDRLVPRLIADASAHAPLDLSHPTVGRDYLYVEDVAGLFTAALRASRRLGGEVLNAGSGRRVTLAELVERVCAFTGSRSEVRWGAFPLASHDRGCWTADVTRLHAALRWRPRFSLEEGLRATIRGTMRS